jgi:hypothetical protein
MDSLRRTGSALVRRQGATRPLRAAGVPQGTLDVPRDYAERSRTVASIPARRGGTAVRTVPHNAERSGTVTARPRAGRHDPPTVAVNGLTACYGLSGGAGSVPGRIIQGCPADSVNEMT